VTAWADLPAGMPVTAAVVGFQRYLATHPDASNLAGLYVDWLSDGIFHASRIERVVHTPGSARRHAAEIVVPPVDGLVALDEGRVECRRVPIAELRQSEFVLPVVRDFFELRDRVRNVPPEHWEALRTGGQGRDDVGTALHEVQRLYRSAYIRWTEDFTLGFIDEPASRGAQSVPPEDWSHPAPWDRYP
jgi:hypothetical protein